MWKQNKTPKVRRDSTRTCQELGKLWRAHRDFTVMIVQKGIYLGVSINGGTTQGMYFIVSPTSLGPSSQVCLKDLDSSGDTDAQSREWQVVYPAEDRIVRRFPKRGLRAAELDLGHTWVI